MGIFQTFYLIGFVLACFCRAMAVRLLAVGAVRITLLTLPEPADDESSGNQKDDGESYPLLLLISHFVPLTQLRTNESPQVSKGGHIQPGENRPAPGVGFTTNSSYCGSALQAEGIKDH